MPILEIFVLLRSMPVRYVQPSNALRPIELTESGISISVKAVF